MMSQSKQIVSGEVIGSHVYCTFPNGTEVVIRTGKLLQRKVTRNKTLDLSRTKRDTVPGQVIITMGQYGVWRKIPIYDLRIILPVWVNTMDGGLRYQRWYNLGIRTAAQEMKVYPANTDWKVTE